VSWYEAAAYARFAQKSLPTVYHWYRAAGSGLFSDILAFSNFKGRGAAAAGANDGLSPFGSYDMAGNVKEWAQNAVGERRYLLGGGWDEGSIKFSYPDAGSPLDRNRTVGFRCASYEAPLGEDLVQNIDFFSLTSRTDPPVDAQTFQIYRDLNSYDKEKAGPLQPEVVLADDSSPYFRREDLSFRAAYGNELVLAHLYLPKNAAPPFQPIVFFGSGDMLDARSIAQLHDPFEFIVRSGRALVIPAYQGTLERGPMPSQPRETMLNWPRTWAGPSTTWKRGQTWMSRTQGTLDTAMERIRRRGCWRWSLGSERRFWSLAAPAGRFPGRRSIPGTLSLAFRFLFSC
jgi:eukaryotic-like serine/threonine-protein kinase